MPDLTPYRQANSALSFADLLLEVARELGIAHYGEAGDEEPQIPINQHDLFECKRHVNNGLRMFFADAPDTGWRFARPVAEVDIWGTVNIVTDTTVTAVTDSNVTIMTSSAAVFFDTMEFKMVSVTDQADDVMITRVISPTVAEIDLNGGSEFTAKTFSIANSGTYTLAPTFAGMVTGAPSYSAASNGGISLSWVDESTIRKWRENTLGESGDPFWLAVRIMKVDGIGNPLNSRRWELLTYPTAGNENTIEFPFELHFDQLVHLTDFPPVPLIHDECIKAACLAVVERDVYDKPGRHWANYHEKTLFRSHRLDARSGPRALGYFGNPSGARLSLAMWRQNAYNRPTVTGDNFN